MGWFLFYFCFKDGVVFVENGELEKKIKIAKKTEKTGRQRNRDTQREKARHSDLSTMAMEKEGRLFEALVWFV